MKKYLTENKFYIAIDKRIQEAESFTATNKKSGKTAVFKSKDARDAAIKSGTHTAKKDNSGGSGDSKNDTPKVNIFNKPSVDNTQLSTSLSSKVSMSPKSIEYWANKSGVDLLKISNDIESGKLNPRDLGTAILIPGTSREQEIVAKYGGTRNTPDKVTKKEPKFKSTNPIKVDDVEDYSEIVDIIDVYGDKLSDNQKKALEVLYAAWEDAEEKMVRTGNDDKYEERLSKIKDKLEKILDDTGISSK